MVLLTITLIHENGLLQSYPRLSAILYASIQNYQMPFQDALNQSSPSMNIFEESIPRRSHPRQLKYSDLIIKEIPDWISCPDAVTDVGIWSVAVAEIEVDYALVLAASIKVN